MTRNWLPPIRSWVNSSVGEGRASCAHCKRSLMWHIRSWLSALHMTRVGTGR